MAKKKKNETLMDYKSQKQILSPIERLREKTFGGTTYKTEYAEMAFKLLSSDDGAKTKSHVCAALYVSKNGLLQWMKKYPEFNEAIITGLEIGSQKWRDKIRKHAFEPTANVNNGLIKLLSSNVYGIKEDSEPTVVIHNTNTSTPEDEMKKRGIPVPKIDTEDTEDVV